MTILMLCGLVLTAACTQSIPGTQFAQTDAGTAASTMADGEVRKVDKAVGTITLKHGEIKSLRMSPMTMVFKVKDRAMLDKVKAGDKVRFAADNVGGTLTVTRIEPAM